MIKSILLILIFLFSTSVFAQYNANMRGEVEGVYIYTDADYIFFRLKNQPVSHPSCDATFFVISEALPYERRQMLLSRLLTAFASGEALNIGYDSQSECANGYIRVHRVG